MAPRCWVFSSPFLAEAAAGVAGGEGVVVLLRCFVLLGWWGPLVDVDDAPGDVDAVGVMVCGVAVSTLGWGPGGWRWWRLFASRVLFAPPAHPELFNLDLPRFAISVSILFRSLNRLPYAVGHARACTRCHVEF